MDYKQSIDYLFSSFPVFDKVGASAYKPGLGNIEELCNHLGNPEKKIKTIHVAGTNGKGSSSHMIAAILQSAGYKTGLYTSPHLKDFSERIKINGSAISENKVTQFVNQNKIFFDQTHASFFEITTAMAFDYFNQEAVDFAVIEVGLGGRLDSTNVILPEISLITNISFDHMEFLGNTLESIAYEKAGIIKPGIPVVISERQTETEKVFLKVAKENHAEIRFASEEYDLKEVMLLNGKLQADVYHNNSMVYDHLISGLGGRYQTKNIPGVLAAIEQLRLKAYTISDEAIRNGIENVTELTGLKGRWQVLAENPMVICDTGHNEAGIRFITEQIESVKHKNLFIVFGIVKDKEADKILKLLPKEAYYYFCQPSIPRAKDATTLMQEAEKYGLKGEVIKDINEAIAKAKEMAKEEDLIFIGGSTFVVAEIDGI